MPPRPDRTQRTHAGPAPGRGTAARRSHPGGGRRAAGGFARFAVRHERALVALLLCVHVALVVWGAARNSVTFDESFHLPAGYLTVTRGDFGVSTVNPPLVKALAALPALALGAHPPEAAAVATRNQQTVAVSFMRANATGFHRLFFAARLSIVLLSVLLGLLIWRFSRRLHGPVGALVSLGFYVFAPEALAHAGLVGMDLATGLALLACIYAWWGFTRSGRWGWFVRAAAACGAAVLVRFTALLFPLVLGGLALVAHARAWSRRPARLWTGWALLAPVVLLALQVGYAGRTSLRPLAAMELVSPAFQSLQRVAPWLRLPLPDDYLRGLDLQAREGSLHFSATFVLGRITHAPVWYYFPLALSVKWPLAFLAALGVRAALALRRRRRGVPAREQAFLLLPAGAFLVAGMFLVQLNAGVRYMFPLLPLLCVWLGGLVPRTRSRAAAPARAAWRAALPAVLVAAQALEALSGAPYYLSFFNRLVGGPGRGDRVVNDSNVDWGQGLIALREELGRRGIGRIHLAYHGTVDPAIYGIGYVPYLGGVPGRESEWLAVSSYYFVGLRQRMTTTRGVTLPVQLDFRALWPVPPVAHPAGCIYLFYVGGGAAPPPAGGR